MIYKLLCCAPPKKTVPLTTNDETRTKLGGPPKGEAQMNEGPKSMWDGIGATALRMKLVPVDRLKGSPIRLLDAHYIINLADSGGIFIRRQDLPEKAFLSLSQVDDIGTMQIEQRGTSLRVIVISHPWLQVRQIFGIYFPHNHVLRACPSHSRRLLVLPA